VIPVEFDAFYSGSLPLHFLP